MNVPDRSRRRRALPASVRNPGKILEPERGGADVQIAAVVLPGGTVAIRVDLDRQSIGIGEIESLTDEMICGAKRNVVAHEVPDVTAQIFTGGQKKRRVIQPETAVRGDRLHSGLLFQFKQNALTALRPKTGHGTLPLQHSEADNLRIKPNRALEVRNRQA